MKSNMKLLVLALFISACGSKKAVMKPDLSQKEEDKKPIAAQSKPTSQEPVIKDEQIFSIIPYDTNDIDLDKLKPSGPKKGEDTIVEVKGFRIQVFVLSDFSRAKEFEETINSQLRDTEHAVYMDFYSPNYRIRIGDFETRDDARKNLQMVKTLGYSDAFIVPDIVRIQRNSE